MKNSLSELIGKIAVTDTAMDPKGTITVNGEVYEAEALDGYIDEGRGVRVTRVRGKRIFVRRV